MFVQILLEIELNLPFRILLRVFLENLIDQRNSLPPFIDSMAVEPWLTPVIYRFSQLIKALNILLDFHLRIIPVFLTQKLSSN
jgi:hypothetical protein